MWWMPSTLSQASLRTISTFSSDIAHPVSRWIWALPMASAELSRRVGKVVGYPPLCDMSDLQ
jgi:hypothetical protein